MATAHRLLVLDSATLYYRAFYALPTSMTDPHGQPNNAVRGFFDGLASLVRQLEPTHLICAWDDDWRPQFRVKLWPAYKAHRLVAATEQPPDTADDMATEDEVPDELAPQVGVIQKLLDTLGMSRIGVAGYEADDVIATVCARAEMPVDIVTSDRDLLQCVDDERGIRLISIARGLKNLETYNASAVQMRYGVTPAQYVDFATLRGDPSDGLPGVPGVGEKTAAALIAGLGNLDAIRDLVAGTGPASSPAAATILKPGVRARIAAVAETLGPLSEVTRAVTTLPLDVGWQESARIPLPCSPTATSLMAEAGVTRQLVSLQSAGIVGE